jgi:hypothetical protein
MDRVNDSNSKHMLTLYKNTQLLPWLVITACLVFLSAYVLGRVFSAVWRLALNAVVLVLVAYALYVSWMAGRTLVDGKPDVYSGTLGQDALQNNLYLTYVLNVFLAVFLAYLVYSTFSHH